MDSTQTKDTGWNMAGTEGTGEYIVLARTSRGRIGVRFLDEHPISGEMFFRVRVEPSAKTGPKSRAVMTDDLVGWKQPGKNTPGFGHQERFSIHACGACGLKQAVDLGVHAIRTPVNAAVGQLLEMEQNPNELPEWAKGLVSNS